MDNEYRQRFTEEVQAAMQQPTKTPKASSPKWLIFITLILGFIVIVETATIIIAFSNRSTGQTSTEVNTTTTDTSDDTGDDGEVSEKDVGFIDAEPIFGLNEEGGLVWLSLTCNTEDGSRIVLTKDNIYKRYDSNLAGTDGGKYTIVNDSLISLDNSSHTVLYYDGYSIADGLTIYECE